MNSEFDVEWRGGLKRPRSDSEASDIIDSKKKFKWVHPLIYTIGNEIHFSADIDKLTVDLLIRQMSKLIEKKYKNINDDEEITITYVVDTPGGSVTAVLKFVDFITLTREKYPNLKLVSVITGLVASAGTIMSIVADKRIMTSNAHAMIHELSSGNSGRFTQMIAYAGFIKELNEKLMDIYLKKTNLEREKLEQLMMKDTWYNASDYKNNGFVDEIK